jgi:hypothetical protein
MSETTRLSAEGTGTRMAGAAASGSAASVASSVHNHHRQDRHLQPLPNDVAHLERLFDLVTARWKCFTPKPSGEVLAKINAVHRQATRGDCQENMGADADDAREPLTSTQKVAVGGGSAQHGGGVGRSVSPANLSAFNRMLLDIWRSYQGTPKVTAQRRFLTLMRDLDPLLLQVHPYSHVPYGFPVGKGANGAVVCPYANSKRGCPHTLTNGHGRLLARELESIAELNDAGKLQVLERLFNVLCRRVANAVRILHRVVPIPNC